MIDVVDFEHKLKKWAQGQLDILAIGLVGSYARNTATENSDFDVMILVEEPSKYLLNNNWLNSFGKVERIIEEDWGAVKTHRVFYDNSAEIEFNIAHKSWAKTNPIDEGTIRPVSDGMKIIYDPEKILFKLMRAVKVRKEKDCRNEL
ncbi:MAG: nucleotidyltransferase domain-containing protein [Patescibacteria group bacterium]